MGKVPDAGKDWGQKKRASEDEMAGWLHQCNGHKIGQTLGDGEGQGGLVCCSSWGCKVDDWTTHRLTWWLTWLRICLQCRKPGFYPWVGKISEEGNGSPFQYSCLENPMDRGAWKTIVHVVTKSQTWLSHTHTHTHTHTYGFPGGSDGKESAFNARYPGLIPRLGPWRREWQPTLLFLPGESYRQRSLTGYHGVSKSQTWLKQFSMHIGTRPVKLSPFADNIILQIFACWIGKPKNDSN